MTATIIEVEPKISKTGLKYISIKIEVNKEIHKTSISLESPRRMQILLHYCKVVFIERPFEYFFFRDDKLRGKEIPIIEEEYRNQKYWKLDFDRMNEEIRKRWLVKNAG